MNVMSILGFTHRLLCSTTAIFLLLAGVAPGYAQSAEAQWEAAANRLREASTLAKQALDARADTEKTTAALRAAQGAFEAWDKVYQLVANNSNYKASAGASALEQRESAHKLITLLQSLQTEQADELAKQQRVAKIRPYEDLASALQAAEKKRVEAVIAYQAIDPTNNAPATGARPAPDFRAFRQAFQLAQETRTLWASISDTVKQFPQRHADLLAEYPEVAELMKKLPAEISKQHGFATILETMASLEFADKGLKLAGAAWPPLRDAIYNNAPQDRAAPDWRALAEKAGEFGR